MPHKRKHPAQRKEIGWAICMSPILKNTEERPKLRLCRLGILGKMPSFTPVPACTSRPRKGIRSIPGREPMVSLPAALAILVLSAQPSQTVMLDFSATVVPVLPRHGPDRPRTGGPGLSDPPHQCRSRKGPGRPVPGGDDSLLRDAGRRPGSRSRGGRNDLQPAGADVQGRRRRRKRAAPPAAVVQAAPPAVILPPP